MQCESCADPLAVEAVHESIAAEYKILVPHSCVANPATGDEYCLIAVPQSGKNTFHRVRSHKRLSIHGDGLSETNSRTYESLSARHATSFQKIHPSDAVLSKEYRAAGFIVAERRGSQLEVIRPCRAPKGEFLR